MITVKYGVKGHDVEVLQDYLKKKGFYKGVVDGKCLDLTVKAIKLFQRSMKIKEDGICGQITWSKVQLKETPKPAVKPFKWNKPIQNLKSNSMGFGAKWLVPGKVHCGRDYNRTEAGTPVMAIGDGIVRYAKYTEEWDCGVCIEHKTPNGLYTSIYWHLEHLTVKEGDTVPAGKIIGKLGKLDKGQAFNVPHLHLGVRKGGFDRVMSIKGGIDKSLFPNGFIDPDTLFK